VSKTQTFNLQQLRGRYEHLTAHVVAQCSLATELVGGQTAGEEGVSAYVKHHLKLTGKEAEEAVQRILREEVGERSLDVKGGELDEKLTYGLHVIRRDSKGAWLGNWMAKACLKAAASRIAIFTEKRGAKGDMAEMGDIRATGISLRDPENPHKIYLIDPVKDIPVTTYYQQFKGRVTLPTGSVSIVNDCECAPPGTRFAFDFRWYGKRISGDDMADIFASAMVIGLGSAKAFERGKFKVNQLTYDGAERQYHEPKTKTAKA
jgi:hypothetical protein